MTPEAQRIAIAEACGWHQKPMAENGPLVWNDGKKFRNEYEIPDYLNDLNAMHEAEKVLNTEALQHTYWNNLEGLTEGFYGTAFATAAQRAEAFLRTIGKWEEDK